MATDPLERAVDRAAYQAELGRLRAALADEKQQWALSRSEVTSLRAALAEAERQRDEAKAMADALERPRSERALVAQIKCLQVANANHRRAEADLALAESKINKALDRLCTSPGEGDLVAAATDMTANYVETVRRAERAEADLAAARRTYACLDELHGVVFSDWKEAVTRAECAEVALDEAVDRARRAEADLAAAREAMTEERLAEIAGWAICAHSEGDGPGKCDLMACACGPDGVAAAKAIARAFQIGAD